jgi:hypothetical protein
MVETRECCCWCREMGFRFLRLLSKWIRYLLRLPFRFGFFLAVSARSHGNRVEAKLSRNVSKPEYRLAWLYRTRKWPFSLFENDPERHGFDPGTWVSNALWCCYQLPCLNWRRELCGVSGFKTISVRTVTKVDVLPVPKGLCTNVTSRVSEKGGIESPSPAVKWSRAGSLMERR